MSISTASVHRPIFTIMIVLIVLIIGGISLLRLPIDLMPDVTNPTISVMTNYENAGPEEVEELITRPIEEAMSAVPGVEEVSSSSVEGSSRVRVKFTWGTDLDAATNDVRDRLDRIASRLPEDADRPTIRKFDLAAFPVLICGVSGTRNQDLKDIRQTIDDKIKNRLERVPGVASLDIWGGQEREIHVNMDVDKIKALDLPLSTILDRIKAENANIPAGTIDRGDYEVLIRTPGEYRNLDELRDTVVAIRKNAPVTLRQIATVVDATPRERQIVRVNGQRGLRMSVQKQSGTNTVEVARGALAEIDAINAEMPEIAIIPIIDTSKFIERSISNVGISAAAGGLLAIFILLFFLRNIRSTLIIGTAIPVSIIATFSLMYFGGFTLNIITLGGLALGVGMLVDNSIVALENIYRHRETGAAAEQAAVNGAAEVAAPILSSTLTTVAVFLPLLFVRGMAGIMYRQLSLVVGFALLCSLTVALTVVPMLAAKLLKPPRTLKHDRLSVTDRLFRLSERLFGSMEGSYVGLLGVALRSRWLVILVAAAVLGASLLLFPLIGTELMPVSDEGEVRINVEMEPGVRADVVEQKILRIEQIVRENVPELESIVSSVGGGGWGPSGSNNADMRLALVGQAKRKRTSEQIAAMLRGKLSGIAGATIRTRMGESVGTRMMTMGQGDDRVQVEIRGHDFLTAEDLGKRVSQIVQNIEGVTDVRVSRESGSPEEQIIIDRLKAAQMKVSVRKIADMLATSLSGTRAGNYREGGDEFPIMVKMHQAERMSLSEVLDLKVVNDDGEPVVLGNMVDVRPRTGPVRIDRKDQERVVTVTANPSERDMGSILADIRRQLDPAVFPVPRNFSIVYGGDYEQQQQAFSELMLSFVLALILVYMVMACQYESLRDPFVIMFSVPLAAVGVLVLLFLTNTTFNIQSFIGCIMLGGIVVNNAIVLVDHINLLRRRDGMELHSAILESGRRRLRPILMTTLTTCLGLLPLALGLGEGSEAQAPMARAVIGGLASATLITLIVVPVIYSIFERRMSHAAASPPAAVPTPADARS